MRLFRKNFCSSDDGMQKLDVFLRKLMIRRYVHRAYDHPLYPLTKYQNAS
jgi:hypothetical protein